MASKKKLDEKHLKILREMVALPHNKQCFDCHQRGPTYINMTIGSYVCTACSGLLRGLNPPHRVKSISMASFTTDEIDFIKCHGNEYCRKVWLGLHDNNRVTLQADGRDESKVKDFMTQKYERKRYYVAPTDSMKEEAKTMNESAISKAPGTKPLKSLLGENAPRIQVGNYQKAAATPPPINSNPQSPGSTSIQSSKSSGSTAMDLLGDLGGDPFASSTPQSQSSSGGGFADFGNFGNTATSSQSQAFSQSAPLQPAGSGSQPMFNGFGSTPASTAPAPALAPPAGGGDKYSNLSDLFSVSSAEESTAPSGWSTSFSSSSSGGMNWGGTQTSTSTSAGGLNWGGDGNSGGGGGLNWNSSSTQSAPASTGMGWGGANNASTSWGGAPATAQSNGLGVPGNPFLSATVSNPFGGNSSTTLTSQSSLGMGGVSQAPTANPFGGQAPVNSSGFGAFGAQNAPAPQSVGFGQFGAQPVSSGGGFGQFGTPASSASAGFGQFGVQNGGFGANTPTTGFGGAQPTMSTGFGAQQGFGAGQPGFGQPAGFGGAGFGAQPTQQGFPQQIQQQPAAFGGQQAQMQGFGGAPGWGQMPASSGSANPFMSTAQQYSNTAPKTGATNPFL